MSCSYGPLSPCITTRAIVLFVEPIDIKPVYPSVSYPWVISQKNTVGMVMNCSVVIGLKYINNQREDTILETSPCKLCCFSPILSTNQSSMPSFQAADFSMFFSTEFQVQERCKTYQNAAKNST